MITSSRQERIKDLVISIDSLSEKYQLVHATFAIEQLLRQKKQERYDEKMRLIVEQMRNETDPDKLDQLYQKAHELREDSNRKCRIIITYVPQLKEDSARTTRTLGDTFTIALPQSMECIRNNDHTVDSDRLKILRKLVAHELGHIVLHSGIIDVDISISAETSEEEADFFASCLLRRRETYSKELYEAVV